MAKPGFYTDEHISKAVAATLRTSGVDDRPGPGTIAPQEDAPTTSPADLSCWRPEFMHPAHLSATTTPYDPPRRLHHTYLPAFSIETADRTTTPPGILSEVVDEIK